MTKQPYREEFESLDQFLAAAVAYEYDRNAPDHRLEFSAAAGLNETFPSEGGFTVPEAFADELWQKVYDTGRILSRCDRQPISRGNSLDLPAIDETSRAQGSRFGGVRSYWLEEGATITASKPKFARLTLQPKKLVSLCYATGELMGDVPALGAWLLRTFGLEASFEIEDALVNGSGAGRPLGILNSGALITVAGESGQAASTIRAENVANMAARLWGPSHRNAIWLTSNDGFAQLVNTTLSNGSPVVTYGTDGGRFILGMPVELTEYTPALGDTGDIILADFSQYLIGEIAPDFISSVHLRFSQDEGVFRLRYRVDGQPAWKSAITPKNSTVTQSPFVALQAR